MTDETAVGFGCPYCKGKGFDQVDYEEFDEIPPYIEITYRCKNAKCKQEFRVLFEAVNVLDMADQELDVEWLPPPEPEGEAGEDPGEDEDGVDDGGIHEI